MARYIELDEVRAKIEKIIADETESVKSFEHSKNVSEVQRSNARIGVLMHIRSLLNTLEVQSLWHDAQGTDLPEIDREVVVFIQKRPGGFMQIAVAHRPNPDGWDGKDIFTGKKRHHTPVTYGKGGWNVPDVKFWLDVELPNPYGEE